MYRRPGGLPYPRSRLQGALPSQNLVLGTIVLESIVPVLVSEDTTYVQSRRDHNAFLIARNTAPTQPGAPWFLFQPERPPQIDDTIYQESRQSNANPLFFWRTPTAQPSTPFNQLFWQSSRLSEPEGDYQRFNHGLYFEFVQPAPIVPPVVLPPPAGGSLPGPPPWPKGELGKGLGPYKRPGQVFGEPDPLSPRLTSRAGEQLPLAFKAPEPIVTVPVEGLTEEELAIVLLLALDETTRR
jgi:hypothetical protein